MSEILRKKLAEQEFKVRQNAKLPDVLGECFAQQLDFIKSEAKRKVLCTTRRSGKSTGAAIYLIHEALMNPRSKLLYVHLTKKEAKTTMWGDIFETVFLKLGIKAELVGLEIRFSNGSIIYLTGIDATPKEMDKLRGKKYRLAVIDECQSFTQDLKQLINQVLGPTLADANATICLCGTPGNQMGEHYWWQVNRPDSLEKGWTFFFWAWKDNPHVKANMQKHVDELLSNDPLTAKTPWFRQEYLGEWVPETDARVYKSEEVNYIEKLPSGFLGAATYILSIDLGYTDATAFVISAYNRYFDKNLYVLESQKKSGLTITAVANLIKEYKNKYNFRSIYVDAANLQCVEEMRQIHSLPLQAAEKAGKEGHIALMNSDLITQNLFIVKSANQELIKELNTLIWDIKALAKGKHKEDGSKDNHLTDALLYGHHGSRHYWFKPPEPKVPVEDAIIVEIEKQFGQNNKKGAVLKKPFWQAEEI